MSTGFPFFMSGVAEDHLRKNSIWFIVLGVVLILTGVLAISYPVMATLATVEVFGFMLLFGAAIEIASTIWAAKWGGFFAHLFCGLLYLFIGWIILERPVLGAAGFTLMLAILFVATGLVRTIFAATHRFSGWGWALVSGLVTLALGIIVWRQLPEAALWVIGTFVGIDLIFNGWSWVMLGVAARSLTTTSAARGTAASQPVGM